jgi:hypothetical protein
MLILYTTLAFSTGTIATAGLWPILGWLALPIGMLTGSLASLAAAATVKERDGDSAHLRDRDERLRDLLDQCPVRLRYTLIDGAKITSERGR